MSDERPTHLDLFSGLGGFAIAAQWAGFRTVAFCEVDARCRAFLEKTWRVHVEPDVRKLDGRRYTGISLLTGGPPCQPASRAGKQGGETDDRWLWPEALRVLDEAKPLAVVFENPPGIGDVGLDGILSEMERIGYEVGTFDIPACAVDSPQLRHRFWIVGFLVNADSGGFGARSGIKDATDGASNGNGKLADPNAQPSTAGNERTDERRPHEAARPTSNAGNGAMADPDSERHEGRESSDESHTQRWQEPIRSDPALGNDNLADTSRNGERGSIAPTGSDCKRAGQSYQYQCGYVADAGSLSGKQRRSNGHDDMQGTGPRSIDTGRSSWSNYVWVPCADGKLRRAPDQSLDVVNGLHRSVLAALGNSISPEVAFQILAPIAACLKGDNEMSGIRVSREAQSADSLGTPTELKR